MPNANFGSALVLLAVASVSFVGIGMMTAVLPLISPEKGTQFGYVAQGLMLVVSGVYYPVSVLPTFMQWIAKVSPATYALRGMRQPLSPCNSCLLGPLLFPAFVVDARRRPAISVANRTIRIIPPTLHRVSIEHRFAKGALATEIAQVPCHIGERRERRAQPGHQR